MRLLVTGASGLLGVNLGMSAAGHTVVGVVNQHPIPRAPFPTMAADIARPAEVERLLDEVQPEAVLHAAAQANIEACERDPDQAWRVNAAAPELWAAACRARGVRLLHVSTDAVFDGQRGGYTEADPTNPLSVYARTKQEAEQRVAAANPDAIIARVNFYGWSLSGTRSLAEFFFNNLSAGRPVRGFTDVYFCPLLATDLARLLLEMLERGLRGLYHVVSGECQSKYDFGVAIARRFGLDAGLIQPSSVMDGGLQAARSPNLTLRTDKLAAALGRPLPGQAAGIEGLYQQHTSGYRDRVRGLGSGVP